MHHGHEARAFFAPAQTNTAFYCQLHEAGHPPHAILRVRHAYRVCCHLFNGRYRKTERAFICHAVGAASSVAAFDHRIDLILSAMLHAAYDSGHFPDGRTGFSEEHRQWLAEQVGEDVERMVAAYNAFDFDLGAPERLAGADIPPDHVDILLIALAHEVDDIADGGLAVAPKYGRSIESRIAACATLARRIGQPVLAETLERHAARYHDMAWIESLEVERLEGFRIIPNLRTYVRLRRDHWRGKSVKVA